MFFSVGLQTSTASPRKACSSPSTSLPPQFAPRAGPPSSRAGTLSDQVRPLPCLLTGQAACSSSRSLIRVRILRGSGTVRPKPPGFVLIITERYILLILERERSREGGGDIEGERQTDKGMDTERQREKETEASMGEIHQPAHSPSADGTHSPGRCPDQGPNL